MSCKSMRQLELELNGVVDNPTNDKISTLEKLLVNFPALEVLHLDSFFVECRRCSKWLPVALNCLWRLVLDVDFGRMVCASSDYAKAVLQYLDTPACLEQPLDKLEYVAIDGFEGSEAELLFLMLCFPTLHVG
ncbi:hypothetical protein P3L10_033751 [Capsicum annuum]